MPDLDKLYQEMKEKGVGVVGMVIDSVGEDGTTDEDTVKKAQILKEKTGVTYPLLIPDAGSMNGRISGLSSFPESFFVDKRWKHCRRSDHGQQKSGRLENSCRGCTGKN